MDTNKLYYINRALQERKRIQLEYNKIYNENQSKNKPGKPAKNRGRSN